MDSIGQERWLRLTSAMARDGDSITDLEQLERSWANDILSGRTSVKHLVEQDYSNRTDAFTLQSLLCHVSAGLAFIHKKPRQESGSLGLSPDQYRQAFIWAAIHLRRFFELTNVQWVPSTAQIVPFGLQSQTPAASSAERWRDFVHYELGSFNVLILSPLARSAQSEAVRDLLKLPWNLIIDLGTASLSVDHSAVRTGIVRQAWPLGSDPDLSVLVRGALWYFANGRTDIGEATPTGTVREWRQKYHTPLQRLLGAIAQRVAPPSVRSLVVGEDFPQEFFRLVLESLDSHLGSASQPAVVGTIAVQPLSDVPMICVSLEEVFQVLHAEQEPSSLNLTEGVLLPHRTERGIRLTKVTLEFAERIGRDLEVVHRGLADWFPPARTFGADFRRGHLIEWSELNNNLDVERIILPALLTKLRAELAKSTNSTVNLLHEPSAGGSTVSRRIAWSLMDEYPVVLLLQMSRNTPEYLSNLFQECGLPLLIVMEAEVVTESERELLFRELLDSNTRAVFLWVARVYGNTLSAEVLSAELGDKEAESFRAAYSQDVLPARADALERLTFDPRLREQRSPFFYGLVAFEESYLGLDRLVEEIVKRLDPTGRELVADLSLVSFYCSEGFPATDFDELCAILHGGDRPVPAISPFTVRIGRHIKVPHRLIAAKASQLLSRVPDRWHADLGRFALTLLQHLKSLKLHESDRLKEMVTSVFLTRDTTALLTLDTDLLAGGLPKQGRFAPLIHDLGVLRLLERCYSESLMIGHMNLTSPFTSLGICSTRNLARSIMQCGWRNWLAARSSGRTMIPSCTPLECAIEFGWKGRSETPARSRQLLLPSSRRWRQIQIRHLSALEWRPLLTASVSTATYLRFRL